MNNKDVNYDSWRDHASEYERGFIDGMQRQAQSSVDRAVNAMSAAPVQEPVAWLMYKGAHKESFWLDKGDAFNFEMTPEHRWEPLYTTPPAAQPAPASWTEMVTANLVREGVNKHKARELAEHFYWFAQRPFVGLTDEERDHIWHVIGNSDAHGDVDGLSGRDVMAAIEAKLRSKNNENTD